MTANNPVTHVHLSVCEDEINEGAKQLLQQIRPNWILGSVQYKLLTDGITNKLVKCTYNINEVVLVRVYGRKTDLLIDRTAETRNIILLHNENLAPQLYATFDNGLCYEYAPGVTLTKENIMLPNIFKLVAEKMARLHLVKYSHESMCEPMIWGKLDQFYALVPNIFTNSQIQKRFTKINVSKEKLSSEIMYMKRALNKYSSPIVFCHNDLLLGNIIYNENENIVTLIDYEYAAMNYQAFDIGNHFNEFAGVESIDYSNYPGKVLQMAWLHEYLRVYWSRDSVTIEQLEDMYTVVNKFGLLSHLLWGLWALIQAEYSTIDFDFIKFAKARLGRYFETKEEMLNLGISSPKQCKSKDCNL